MPRKPHPSGPRVNVLRTTLSEVEIDQFLELQCAWRIESKAELLRMCIRKAACEALQMCEPPPSEPK